MSAKRCVCEYFLVLIFGYFLLTCDSPTVVFFRTCFSVGLNAHLCACIFHRPYSWNSTIFSFGMFFKKNIRFLMFLIIVFNCSIYSTPFCLPTIPSQWVSKKYVLCAFFNGCFRGVIPTKHRRAGNTNK